MIYLDNHATTRLDPRVLEAMLPWLTDHYGNAGSTTHEMGREARAAVDAAREEFAAAVGATAREIVFTSGATESDNLALLGTAARRGSAGGHLITVATEHHAVLDPVEHLERGGIEVTRLPVAPRTGLLDPAAVHDHHQIGKLHRLLLIMVVEDGRQAGGIVNIAQALTQFLHQHRRHPLRKIGAFHLRSFCCRGHCRQGTFRHTHFPP